jgi:hypothetical protein
MNSNEERLTCARLREMDMVDYLAGLGHQPTKIKGNNYWYVSPLREERTASFKVSRSINRWYDHGMGKGGNLIDFAILYHDCTVAALLKNMVNNFSFQPPALLRTHIMPKENTIQVIDDCCIRSGTLVNYLKERHIPVEIANKFCREVRYQLNKKIYSAIGFKNDLGGYELRNPYFKNSSSPKGITTIKNGCQKVAVFEGFFDFLSFLVLYQNGPCFQWDFCILNSLSFFEKARPFLEQYNRVHLFLDTDPPGQNCSLAALKGSEKYIDGSSLYKGYKDLNECLVGGQKVNRNSYQRSIDSIPP